jgi:hypothetical protein
MKKLIAAALCVGLTSACATNPDKISAQYVSPLAYQGYNCDQIRTELVRVSSRVSEVTGQQRKQASNDALAMGVGLVIFWPALFFLAGGSDKKDELGRLKGEYDALQVSANEKSCNFATAQAAAAPAA